MKKIIFAIIACVLSVFCILLITGSHSASADTQPAEPAVTQEQKEKISNSAHRRAHTDYLSDANTNTWKIVFKGSDYDLFKKTQDTTWVFWDFYQTGTVGVGKDTDYFTTSNHFYQNTENVFFSEGYFGLNAVIQDNRTLIVTPTVSYDSDAVLTDIKLTDGYFAKKALPYEYDRSTQTLTADLYDDCYQNSIYVITGIYSYHEKIIYCNLYLFVDCASDQPEDYEFYICKGARHNLTDRFDPCKRHEMIQNLLDENNCTPEKMCDPHILYPNIVTDYEDTDTEYWIQKSYEILQDYPDCSDEMKILLFHDWITSNLAYDNYDVKELSGSRRYWDIDKTKSALCGDKNNYVSKTKTGVCADYTAIFIIMCREHGIPCAGISIITHVWNVVYLHDRWIEIDITQDVERFTEEYNYRNITGTDLYHYKGYCTDYVNEIIPVYVNQFIRNRE